MCLSVFHEYNSFWKRKTSRQLAVMFLFFVAILAVPTHCIAQVHKPTVTQIKLDEIGGITRYIYQDSTGLIWIFSIHGNWAISDGERVFEVDRPGNFNSNNAYVWTSKINDRFYFSGDSLRIFNPYSRKFEQSIGLHNTTNLESKANAICCPLLLNDGTLIAGYAPEVSNHSVVPLISKDGTSFVKWESKHNINFNGYSSSIATRDNDVFINRHDSILQFNVSGELIKVHTLPKHGMYPYCTKNHYSSDEAVDYFHLLLDSVNQQLYPVRFALAPNDDEFKLSSHPKLKNSFRYKYAPYYPNLGITEIDGDYWKWSEFDMKLTRYSPHKDPINYFDFVREKYTDLNVYQKVIHHAKADIDGHAIWAMSQDMYALSNIDQPYTHYWSADEEATSCQGQRCVMRGMTADNQGHILIGHESGIKRLNTSTGATSDLNFELQNSIDYINSLTYVNEKLYANAFEIDTESGTCHELVPNIADHRVTHYVDTSHHLIWIADGGYLRDKTDSIEIFQFDINTEKTTKVAVIRNPMGHFIEASQFHMSSTTQTMFLATVNCGLIEMDLAGKVLNHYSDSSALVLGDFLSLYEDDAKKLWIGQKRLDKLNLITRAYTKNVISTSADVSQPDRIYSIQKQDETYAWLGTHEGIYRLNTKTGACQDFDMIEGISNVEFNRLSHYRSDDGTLFFGALDGLYAFHPDQLLESADINNVFPIAVLRFSVFDNELDSLIHHFHHTSSTYEILPTYKYVSFDVYIPDYRNPEKNKYTWWLEGYDKSWNTPTTENQIRYENVPAGAYTLHVKGGLSPSFYQSSLRKFNIIVHQVWYKTTFAFLCYGLLLLSLIYLLYRYLLAQRMIEAEGRRLKELDEVKTKLYTNITHEFRTPLTVIMGMTDNIEGHEEEKKLITRNSKNLLNLINQMLDLSKVESGAMVLELTQSNIISYLEYLTESFYSLAEENKIRLLFYSELKSLVMDFDDVKLQHIINNLLSNAIKFSRQGDKVVLHASEVELNANRFLQLKVKDTGIGIDKEEVHKIFDRFHQANNSISSQDELASLRTEGTGVGLALTKELVGLMKGQIDVESELGKGSTFTIHLPIVKDKATPHRQKAEIEPVLNLDQIRQGEKPQVLIIEDNVDVMTYISNLIKPMYDIVLARNGEEGLNKAFEIIPDLIISDVMMPIKDGYEVCQTLKRDQRTSHVPVILLTAKSTTKDRLEGLSEGADAYLVKPFNREELFIRIKTLLELRRNLQKRFGDFKQLASAKPSLDKVFLQKLISIVDQKLNESDLSVKDLCEAVQLSNMQVNRKLKALTGKTPSGFIRSIRLQKGMELLKTTSMTISEIAYSVGFNNPNYFSRAFSQEFGAPPSSIRK